VAVMMAAYTVERCRRSRRLWFAGKADVRFGAARAQRRAARKMVAGMRAPAARRSLAVTKVETTLAARGPAHGQPLGTPGALSAGGVFAKNANLPAARRRPVCGVGGVHLADFDPSRCANVLSAPTMRFPQPVIRGSLIQRYKRFLADVRLDDGRIITASCPNTGSMLGLTAPGSPVWLSESDSPTRKYRFTWEMVEADLGHGPTLVGINTQHPNRLVAEAVAARRIRRLVGYPDVRREVRYGENSRIDILLQCARKGLCYVEVKNVHLSRRHGLAEFPDSITARGTKHLVEMARMVRAGHRAIMVFLIQRADARKLALARDVDASYGVAFDAARAAGVEAIALRCRLSTEEISIDRAVPITG